MNNKLSIKCYLSILLFMVILQSNVQGDSLVSPGTTGSIGTVTINEEVYSQFSLRPEFSIGKLGIGLDLYIYFNDSGLYPESWDFTSLGSIYNTLSDKMYYVRWGMPGDNFYLKTGALDNITIGKGILVNDYSNIMDYPQVRQIGLNVQARIDNLDFEFLYSNIKTSSPGVASVRTSYNLSSKLNMGLSFVIDRNQIDGLPDIDEDGYPDYYDFYPSDKDRHDNINYWQETYNSIQDGDSTGFSNWYKAECDEYNSYDPSNIKPDPVSGFSIDISYNLSNNISFYTQLANLNGEILDEENYKGNSNRLGWGFVPIGIVGKIGLMKFIGEYRMSSERFIFNYWDKAYDLNRVSVNALGITTRESNLYKYGKLNGIYLYSDFDLTNMFIISLGYQKMKGGKWNNNSGAYESGRNTESFIAKFSINSKLIPKLGKAEAFYQQSNVPDPFKFNPNLTTVWGYSLGAEVSSSVMLVYELRTTYIADINNLGNFIPVETVQIETQFIF